MSSRLKRFMDILEFEIATHYRFPFLEILCSIVIFESFYLMVNGSLSFYYILQKVPIPWVSAHYIESIGQWIAIHGPNSLGAVSFTIAELLIFLVPILTSLSIARDMDRSLLRTLCSYPISRSQIFLSKLLLILIPTCGTASISLIIALVTFEPGPIPIEMFGLGLLIIWVPTVFVAMVTMLLALLSKSLPASLFGGLAVAFAMQQLPYIPFVTMRLFPDLWQLPVEVVAFFNPHFVITKSITDDFSTSTITALSLGSLVPIVASIVLLIIGIYYFKKMDV